MALSGSPLTIAVFPNVDPVFTRIISPSWIFISGDSSYFSQEIYVHLLKLTAPSCMLDGLMAIAPPPSLTISLTVYPLNPILPTIWQTSPIGITFQSLGMAPNSDCLYSRFSSIQTPSSPDAGLPWPPVPPRDWPLAAWACRNSLLAPSPAASAPG